MQPLNLSRELVQGLVRILREHDEQCQDPVVGAQYLAAVIGLLVGNTDRPAADKEEMLAELSAFSGHVLHDVISSTEQRPAPPPVDPAKAFGIWKPPG